MNIYFSQHTDRGAMLLCRRHTERDEYPAISSWAQSRLFVRQTGILTILARPLHIYGEHQSYSFCLLLSRLVPSVTNKETNILRESSAVRATLLRTSPSPTWVAVRDKKRNKDTPRKLSVLHHARWRRENLVFRIFPLLGESPIHFRTVYLFWLKKCQTSLHWMFISSYNIMSTKSSSTLRTSSSDGYHLINKELLLSQKLEYPCSGQWPWDICTFYLFLIVFLTAKQVATRNDSPGNDVRYIKKYLLIIGILSGD